MLSLPCTAYDRILLCLFLVFLTLFWAFLSFQIHPRVCFKRSSISNSRCRLPQAVFRKTAGHLSFSVNLALNRGLPGRYLSISPVVSYTTVAPLPVSKRSIGGHHFCGTILTVTCTGRYPAVCPLVPGLSSGISARDRSGKKRAIIAVARMILTAVYHMLSTGESWNPTDLYKIDMPEPLKNKQKEKAVKQAMKLLIAEGLIKESQLTS